MITYPHIQKPDPLDLQEDSRVTAVNERKGADPSAGGFTIGA